jgi:hypothetical protein
MATVNFLYRSSLKNAPLNVRLLFRHDNNDFSKGAKTQLKIYSHVELIQNDKLSAKLYWGKLHQKKKVKNIDVENKQTEVNSELNKIKNYILKQFSETNIIEVINDKDWLKKAIDTYYNPIVDEIELPTELLRYYDYYLEEKKNNLAKQTLKNYNVVKNLLIRFERSLGNKIKISNVDLRFKNSFEKYCLEQGYAMNTISRAVNSVKTICYHARRNNIEISHQLEDFKYKKVKAEKIYLSFDELECIEKAILKTEHLINARDWLIISCYIGQRISDFMCFTSSHLRKDKENLLIEFTQKKTGTVMTVGLHPKIKEILKKRNGDFPKPLSHQKYNHYIKTICQISNLKEKVRGSKQIETYKGSKVYRKQIGIYEKWELISSHVGRRSFATNFYGKVPTPLLIRATGHSSEKMFLSYIGKSNKDLAMEILNYF